MTKVSVIIPVYNSEEYLKDAVSTVLKQTLNDIEIILVNDCSTDQSRIICDKLSRDHEIIRVLHLEKNKGICGARNEGFDLQKENTLLSVIMTTTLQKIYWKITTKQLLRTMQRW